MNKKLFKKVIILAVIAIIIGLVVCVFTPSTVTITRKNAEIEGFKLEQNVNYGTAKIISYDKESKYIKAAESGHKVEKINNMVIPEVVEIDGEQYKITEIGENAFSNTKAFETLTLPETVEKVEAGAFTGCTNLKKVVVSNPKIVIDSSAFDTKTENENLVFSYKEKYATDLTDLEVKIITSLNSADVIKIGAVSWNNSKAEVGLATEYTKYTLQYRVNEGAWQEGTSVSNLNLNDKVEARLAYGDNYSTGYATYTVAYANDTTKPTVSLEVTNVTASEITVKATASDSQTGLNGEYKWYLGSTLKETTNTDTYTFTGLSDYTSYTLKVEVSDNCSNTNTASTSQKTNAILANHNSSSFISFSNFTYSDGSYKINISRNSDLTNATLLYQINAYEADGWKEIANNATISDLADGDVVYAKLINGEDSTTGYASYTIVSSVPVIESFEQFDVDANCSSSEIGISYRIKDAIGLKSIEIYVDGNRKYNYDYPSGYTTDWNSTTLGGFLPNTSYKIKIVVTNTQGRTTEQTKSMSTLAAADEQPPTISSFYQNYNGTDYITVYYSVSDDVCLESVEIYCGVNKYYPNFDSFSDTYASGYFDIRGLSPGTSYEVTIYVTDKAGNTTERTEIMNTQSCDSGSTCDSGSSSC